MMECARFDTLFALIYLLHRLRRSWLRGEHRGIIIFETFHVRLFEWGFNDLSLSLSPPPLLNRIFFFDITFSVWRYLSIQSRDSQRFPPFEIVYSQFRAEMIDGGVHAPPMNWFLFIKRSGNSDGSKANREIAETVTNQQVDLPSCAFVAPPFNRWNGIAHSGK